MLHLSGFIQGVVQKKKREHKSFYATFQIFHFETPVSGSPAKRLPFNRLTSHSYTIMNIYSPSLLVKVNSKVYPLYNQ